MESRLGSRFDLLGARLDGDPDGILVIDETGFLEQGKLGRRGYEMVQQLVRRLDTTGFEAGGHGFDALARAGQQLARAVGADSAMPKRTTERLDKGNQA